MLVLLASIVRTKILAVLLGPAGFGLMAVYMSIGDLAAGLAGLGVDRSGVRQIAVSVGTGDKDRIASTALVVKRLSVLLGLAGALVVALASPYISELTFGDRSYAAGIALVSLMVFCKVVTGGQSALIQGLRRIQDLAMLGIVGAFGGAVVSVLLVYVLGPDAVAHAVVGIAAVALAVSWWYSRPSRIGLQSAQNVAFRREGVDLVKLGFAFMASAFLMLGASYVVRIMVIRYDGLQAAGYYQAAWALGGMYVGTILQAMGADFYPRLSASIFDHAKVNRLVNEQTHVSLLLAGPGIAATLGGSAILLMLFYSSDFIAAAGMLHWICFGMALRVITWPMGYIIVAQGRQTIFFLTELAWAVVNVLLSWICIAYIGLVGVGVAFFLSYVFHCLMIFPIVHRLTGFRWTSTNIRLGIGYLALTAGVLTIAEWLGPWQAFALGSVMFIVSGLYSVRSLAGCSRPIDCRVRCELFFAYWVRQHEGYRIRTSTGNRRHADQCHRSRYAPARPSRHRTDFVCNSRSGRGIGSREKPAFRGGPRCEISSFGASNLGAAIVGSARGCGTRSRLGLVAVPGSLFWTAPAVRRTDDCDRYDDGSDTNTAEIDPCDVRNAGGSGQGKGAWISAGPTSRTSGGYRCALARSVERRYISRKAWAGPGRYRSCDCLEAFAAPEGRESR